MNKEVLLVEDDSGIVFTLTDRLEAEGYNVSHAADGLVGEKQALENNYDVIILDVMLPGRDGFQICQNIREQGNTTPVLMLTARSTNIDTVMGLRLGADDYLTKPFDMSILLARLEALIRRHQTTAKNKQINTTPDEITFDDFCLNSQKQELTKQGEPIPLNAQEYRLLHYFLTHPDQVLSRDELLDAVWGYNSEVTTRTVDVHVAWIRKKIDDHPVAKHLITLRGRGYKWLME